MGSKEQGRCLNVETRIKTALGANLIAMPVERRLRHDAQPAELLGVLHLQVLLLLDALPNDHLLHDLLQLAVEDRFLLAVALLAHDRADAIEAARQARLFAHFLHGVRRISVDVWHKFACVAYERI